MMTRVKLVGTNDMREIAASDRVYCMALGDCLTADEICAASPGAIIETAGDILARGTRLGNVGDTIMVETEDDCFEAGRIVGDYHLEASLRRDGQVLDCSQAEVLGDACGATYLTEADAISAAADVQSDIADSELDPSTTVQVVRE